jgi:hypothetical protein
MAGIMSKPEFAGVQRRVRMVKSSDSGLEVMMIRSFQSVVVLVAIVVSAPIAQAKAFQTQKGPPASL